MRKKEFFLNKDSINFHCNNKKRKYNEPINFSSPGNQNEIDTIFNETENFQTTEKTKSYLKIKISSIIGKFIFI